jgi:hypothetical protein
MYKRWLGRECSPVRQSARQQLTASMVEMVLNWRKLLLAWLPSCTQAPRTIGKALPAMRSDKESSHLRWVGVTHMIHDGRWRIGPMMEKPEAK